MAVYEYGDGSIQSLHSSLHPVAVERVAVPDHPEVLFVPAKDQELRLADVESTLDSLAVDYKDYERSPEPRHQRELPRCWSCGGNGHLARECWSPAD